MRMLCGSLWIVLLLPWVGLASPEPSAYVPKNLYLVRVTTLEVGNREVGGPSPRITIPEARFEVTKVYVGPDWLKKRRFTCDVVPYQSTVSSPLQRLHVNVAFEQGAEGLWWVAYDSAGEGALLPVRQAGYVDALGIRSFPYQKMLNDGNRQHKTRHDMDAAFQEGLRWAEAAEHVDRAASDEKRAELLRKYAREATPVAGWAIAWLTHSGKSDLAPFFRTLLADEKQSLENQVLLDRALSAVAEATWQGSKEQLALHQRWRVTHSPAVLPLPLKVLEAERRWSPTKSGSFGGFGP